MLMNEIAAILVGLGIGYLLHHLVDYFEPQMAIPVAYPIMFDEENVLEFLFKFIPRSNPAHIWEDSLMIDFTEMYMVIVVHADLLKMAYVNKKSQKTIRQDFTLEDVFLEETKTINSIKRRIFKN